MLFLVRKVVLVSALGLLSLAATSGCAIKTERAEVNKEVATEPQPASRADLQKESEALIKNGKFTAEQKTALQTLHKEMVGQMKQLNDESLRIRSLLLKEVISKNGDKLEVSVLEDKMKENSNKRLKLIFDAVKKTNQILGRNSIEQDRLRIYDDIIMRQDY